MEEIQSFFEKEEFFIDRDLTYARDALTRLFNRETIFNYLDSLLANKRSFAMLMCDIDNFKYVNDNYGHSMGDDILKRCSANLERAIGDISVIGRFGGDEFVAIVPDVEEYDDLWHVCRRITVGCNNAKIEELKGAIITMTIGGSRFPLDGGDADEIFDKADKALYRGKQKGRNCFIIYLEEKHKGIVRTDSSASLYSSIEMHSNIFSMLTYDADLNDNIMNTMKFLSSNLMLDHICIQSHSEMVSEVIHNLSRTREYKMIPESILSAEINSSGLFRCNNISNIKDAGNIPLYEALKEQDIRASLCVRIMAYGKDYGLIRVDATSSNGRVWQNEDINLLIVFANVLGMILYFTNADL